MLHTPMIIYDKILFLINNVNSTFQVYGYRKTSAISNA